MHGIIKVVLDGGAQRHNIRLVFEEALTQLELALKVILDLVKPVFLILFVERFEGPFQVALDKVKERLLVGSSEEKADRISIRKGPSGRNDQLCDFNQKLVVLGAV